MMRPRQRAKFFVTIVLFFLGLAVLASVPAWAGTDADLTVWSWDKWRFFGDLLMGSVVIGNTVYTWLVNRTRVNKAAIESLRGDLHGIRGRVVVLETEVRHLPDHDDLGELHEKVNQVANVMGEMKGEMHGINRTLTLIHESLLSERNGK